MRILKGVGERDDTAPRRGWRKRQCVLKEARGREEGMRLLDLSGSGGGAESGISSELAGRRARSAARGAGAPGRVAAPRPGRGSAQRASGHVREGVRGQQSGHTHSRQGPYHYGSTVRALVIAGPAEARRGVDPASAWGRGGSARRGARTRPLFPAAPCSVPFSGDTQRLAATCRGRPRARGRGERPPREAA